MEEVTEKIIFEEMYGRTQWTAVFSTGIECLVWKFDAANWREAMDRCLEKQKGISLPLQKIWREHETE